MMTYIESIFLGIVQGITEFLPVSSSGHLWLVEHWIIGMPPSLSLEVAFHFATVLAVICIYWQDIWTLIRAFFSTNSALARERTLSYKLLAATAITGVIGIWASGYIQNVMSPTVLSITLLITAGLVLVSEYASKKKQPSISNFSWPIALFLGAVQAIAIFPGISRSGITIAFLILIGIPKIKSLEISFLLSVPTILASFLFLLPDISWDTISIPVLLTGGIAAFITAYATIRFLQKHIEAIWKWFALWCIILAVFIVVYVK